MEYENTCEQVSCGHQLITFSDPQHRVDSGHVHRLALQVRLGHNQTCHTVIRLNGTHTMRGEQETTWVPHLPLYIYLGGAPRDMLTFTDTDLTLPTKGLRGCILSALLGQQEVSLFNEAVTGQDVTECDSAVCSKSPCHNGGVCNQVGPAATGKININDNKDKCLKDAARSLCHFYIVILYVRLNCVNQ